MRFVQIQQFILKLLILCNQIVEEAGGAVTRMDGGKFCVFDRSVLVSNGAVHAKVRPFSCSCHVVERKIESKILLCFWL